MYHIIVNPASRSGKGIQIWQNIVEPALAEKQVAYQVYFSEKAGDVAQLAAQIQNERKQAQPASLINERKQTLSASLVEGNEQGPLSFIVLGGDGTINEFLQGMEDLSQVELGYIPTGSSNDLARDLRIPKDPKAALELILNAQETTSIDVGVVTLGDGTTLRFAVSCGIGYDANVCAESAQSKIKKVLNHVGLGKLTYLGIALKQIITSKVTSCTLTVDEQDPITIKKLLFIATMIHKYEGGGFMFCPDADPQDGILNLCSAGNLPKPIIPFILPTAFFGKHFFFKNINVFEGRKVTIEAPVELWVHTDGEARYKTSKITLTCMQQALKMYF